MKHITCLKIIFIIIVCVAGFSCNREEPFDVLAAQQKLLGKWKCTDYSGEVKGDEYQITVERNCIMNVHIRNLLNLGENEFVIVQLLDEKNVFIPPQTKESYIIEGEGAISDEYKKMVFELDFNDGNASKHITVTCNKVQ